MTIAEIIQKYKDKLDYLDMEILIAHSLGKTREFVLTYPEYSMTKIQNTKINKYIRRRISSEPIAYILGRKEFYGLDFIVNKHTLVPRPETEQMVEEVLQLLPSTLRGKTTVMDIGTGSGCIPISIASKSKDKVTYFASDISKGALKIAKRNAKLNKVDRKIKFLKSDLLSAFIQNTKYKIFASSLSSGQNTNLIITANLPYLSKEIYESAPVDVKKFEPKSALYSGEAGLAHYRKLLEQIKIISHQSSVTVFLEISPEQKISLSKIIKSIFPTSKIEFKKDLANKWRLCKINI